MREDIVVPALVAQAETETVSGLKQLAATIGAEYKEQSDAQHKADCQGLLIGRLICEFAGQPETQARLALFNQKAIRGKFISPHGFVARKLAELANADVPSESHLMRCARAYQKALKNGLPLNISLRAVENHRDVLEIYTDKNLHEEQPAPDRLFNPDTTGDAKTEASFDPSREAVTIARRMKGFFYDESGQPRFASAEQREEFLRKLNEQFNEFELPCEIVAA